MKEFYTNVELINNYIYYRSVDSTGERNKRKIKYAPSLFTLTHKASEYKTLSGCNAERIRFDSVSEARNYLENYKNVSNLEIYGNNRFLYTFIADTFKDKVEYDFSKLVIAYLDIETSIENGFPDIQNPQSEITAVTLKINNTFYVFGCSDYTSEKDNVRYFKCENEKDLIEKFFEVWTHMEPDIVTGWNIEYFDIPYIVNRCALLFGFDFACRLSVWGKIKERKDIDMGTEKTAYDISGISVLDYLDLYRKFRPKQESNKLNYIAYVELGEKKIDYSEYGNLDDLRKENYQLFIDYNIKDVELVCRLEEKLEVINMVTSLAYNAKVNFTDVFSQVCMWDAILFNHFKQKKMVFPLNKEKDKAEQYAGAFVKEPQIGPHEWIVSFDVDSLYPNLIMQLNISPENISPRDFVKDTYSYDSASDSYDVSPLMNKTISTEHLKEKNLSMAGNGHCFKTDSRGFLAEVLDVMYSERMMYKKRMIVCKIELQKLSTESETKEILEKKEKLRQAISQYSIKQNTIKLCLNSLYGALGTQYFRFFDVRLAEAVTLTGQYVIQKISNNINDYLNSILKSKKDYIVANDTDSCYISLDDIVDKFFSGEKDKHKIVNAIDKFSKEKIQKVIETACLDIQEYLNCQFNRMNMKREIIADKGIWIAKKRYLLNVYDEEGKRYVEPDIKASGIESMRSSTPEICRKEIKKCLSIIMNKTEKELQDYISDFRNRFLNSSIGDVAFPRGCNGLNKYTDDKCVYKKGTPIQVRGALLYNHLVKKNKLQKKYSLIGEGDKIKFVYLKMPNPIHENIIAFPDTGIPKELNLHSYIDRELQFQKVFIDPMSNILDVIHWSIEKRNTLDSFF